MSKDIVEIKPSDRVMDKWVVTRMIDWAAGPKANETTKNALRHEIAEVESSLAGPNPTPTETPLAETAALNWFAVRLFEANFAAATNSESGLNIVQSEFHQRRIDRAHRRLLASLKRLPLSVVWPCPASRSISPNVKSTSREVWEWNRRPLPTERNSRTE